MAAAGRLRVHPSRHALILALALLVMGILAVNNRSNAAWLLVSVAAAAGLASLVHGQRNLRPLTVEVLPVAAAPAGAPLVLVVRVRNPARDDAHGLAARAPGAEAAIPLVPAGGDGEAALTLPPLPRGVWPPPVVEVVSAYPLGLALWIRRHAPAGELVVHPAPRGRSLAEAGVRGPGAAPDGGRVGDNDFRGHRRLHPGDSQRRVDWKASERGEHLLVKEWSGGTDRQCVLAWSATAGGDEERLSQLARWVLEADADGIAYALVLPGRALAAATGPAHRQACLRALAVHGREARG